MTAAVDQKQTVEFLLDGVVSLNPVDLKIEKPYIVIIWH